MEFLKNNGLQILVTFLSIALGVAVFMGKISPQAAVALGGILAGFGLHLPAVDYSTLKPPPGAGVVLLVAGVTAAPLALTMCNPQQAQAVIADLSPAGACVLQEALAGASPLDTIKACAPMTLAAAISVVEEFLKAAPDAGTPLRATPAQDLVLRSWLAQAKSQAQL